MQKYPTQIYVIILQNYCKQQLKTNLWLNKFCSQLQTDICDLSGFMFHKKYYRRDVVLLGVYITCCKIKILLLVWIENTYENFRL